MPVYALIDPRTNEPRYVGRSRRPPIRLRRHLKMAHSTRLRDWISELRSMGLVPELRLLDGGTEREWIVRLAPDLNILDGKGDLDSDPDEVTVSIRFPQDVHADATDAAKADDRSLNSLVVKAVRAYLQVDRKGGNSMGRNGSVSCVTCRKDYDLGYGPSTTWMDWHPTVAAFDAQLAQYNLTPETIQGRNRCVRSFLAEHEGHKFEWWSSDYAYIDDKGDLRGDYDDDLILEGVGSYEKFYGRADGTLTKEAPEKGE